MRPDILILGTTLFSMRAPKYQIVKMMGIGGKNFICDMYFLNFVELIQTKIH